MSITMYDGGILKCETLEFSYESGRYVLIADEYYTVPIEEVQRIETID